MRDRLYAFLQYLEENGYLFYNEGEDPDEVYQDIISDFLE